MSVTLQDLIDGAQDACDKRDDPSVSTDLWRRFINAAIKSLYKKLVAQHADTWITSVDFTIASAATNVYSFDETFDQLRHVTRDPATQNRRPVRPFSLQEVDDFRGEVRYRVMGRKLYFEPPESAPGNYRAWYVPRPQEFLGAVLVRLATTAALEPGPWIEGEDANELRASDDGGLTVDGITAALGDLILVKDEIAQTNNGIWRVTEPGPSVDARMVRVTGYRVGDTLTSAIAFQATEGNTNAGLSFSLFGGPAVIDDDPLIFASNVGYLQVELDVTLDPYDEYITEYAAALALEKEQSDSSQQRARCAAIEADIEALAGAQEAGAQVAIADVEDDIDPRRRRHPYPFT